MPIPSCVYIQLKYNFTIGARHLVSHDVGGEYGVGWGRHWQDSHHCGRHGGHLRHSSPSCRQVSILMYSPILTPYFGTEKE